MDLEISDILYLIDNVLARQQWDNSNRNQYVLWNDILLIISYFICLVDGLTPFLDLVVYV